ncbi:hypothetical protein ID866_7210 [Astraeus odoratus]|nr:hypothetical protein ID866_7210 [Astraeus odoratus]
MTERKKDKDWYMTLVTFQVSSFIPHILVVPRHTLESRSKVFEDMFSFPPPPDTEVEGSSDERPIRLDTIKADEFRSLLKVLFSGPSGPGLPLSSAEWISVLKLSQMWQFEDIQTIALDNLPYSSVKKSVVKKVALAFQYDIRHWLLPGINQLARRPQPISAEDVQVLGLDVALKVAAVRESLVVTNAGNAGSPTSTIGSPNGSPCRHSRHCLTTGDRYARSVDFTPTIKKVFGLPDQEPNGDADAAGPPED